MHSQTCTSWLFSQCETDSQARRRSASRQHADQQSLFYFEFPTIWVVFELQNREFDLYSVTDDGADDNDSLVSRPRASSREEDSALLAAAGEE